MFQKIINNYEELNLLYQIEKTYVKYFISKCFDKFLRLERSKVKLHARGQDGKGVGEDQMMKWWEWVQACQQLINLI